MKKISLASRGMLCSDRPRWVGVQSLGVVHWVLTGTVKPRCGMGERVMEDNMVGERGGGKSKNDA